MENTKWYIMEELRKNSDKLTGKFYRPKHRRDQTP